MGRRKNIVGALDLILDLDDPRPTSKSTVAKRLNRSAYETERYRNEIKTGWEHITVRLRPEDVVRLRTLMLRWGFGSRTEAVTVAVAYLWQQTVKGLDRIDLE
jgi:hypothetical protein